MRNFTCFPGVFLRFDKQHKRGHRSLGYRFVHGLAVGDIAYHPDLRSRLCSAGSQLPYWGKKPEAAAAPSTHDVQHQDVLE